MFKIHQRSETELLHGIQKNVTLKLSIVMFQELRNHYCRHQLSAVTVAVTLQEGLGSSCRKWESCRKMLLELLPGVTGNK